MHVVSFHLFTQIKSSAYLISEDENIDHQGKPLHLNLQSHKFVTDQIGTQSLSFVKHSQTGITVTHLQQVTGTKHEKIVAFQVVVLEQGLLAVLNLGLLDFEKLTQIIYCLLKGIWLVNP